jgi:hypothetical protein
MLDVAAVYAYCLGIKKVYPPGHWLGFTLILGSVVLAAPRGPEHQSALIISAALTVFAAGLWTFGAIKSH